MAAAASQSHPGPGPGPRSAVPRVRSDLEYVEREVNGDTVVMVRDPLRGTYFRFNPLQGAMLQALDGQRSAAEITAALSERFEVEIPPESAERFIGRVRELMLLEINAYDETSQAALAQVRKALRRAGFRVRSPEPRSPGAASDETRWLAAAFAELERDHPRAAARYLTQILARHPAHARARELYDLIQTAYLRSAGATTDFPTWKLFNPARLLDWLNRTIGGFLFSWIGVVTLLAYCCAGAYAYTNVSFDQVSLAPAALAIALVLKTGSGLLHEVGHGLACSRYGGKVTEIGFTLFYYVQPAFYCDTSSSYLLTERRHKLIVQLAGTIVSLTWMSTLAIVMLILSPSVAIYPGLALALALSGVLVFVNLVPFVKFDGYYAICDYLGFPNLRDRSFKLARAWLSKRLLGIELATERLPRRTRALMIGYAAVSFLFTVVLIYFGYSRVLTPVVERFRGPGLVLSVVVTAYLLRNLTLRPIGRLARLLVRERRRIFTPRRTLALAVLAAAAIAPWWVRWPVLVDADCAIVPAQRAAVRARTAGRVDEILVAEGEQVRRGQPLAVLRNPALRAQIAMLGAERAAAAARLAERRAGARAEELALGRRRLDRARAEVTRAAGDARAATRLADAALATRSQADAAHRLVAASEQTAGAARWGLSLLEAGTRREAIAVAEAELARIDSQLARLRADAELLILQSPIDGVVATPHLEDRRQIALAPGDGFAEVDSASWVAEIALSQRDPLGEIAVGDEVVLRAWGDPDREIRTRIERIRTLTQDAAGEPRVVAVTSPFAVDRPIAGLAAHARIYGAERSLAYANLYLVLRRLVNVRLWSMW